ncbi:pentapeptide repeat-containing protein [Thermodesulfobacteriota bacterium]
MNPEHYDKLRKGVVAWNKWRKENPGIKPDLERAVLSKVNLQKANLRKANLMGVDFTGTNLQKASLTGANLQKAFLPGVNLQEADLVEADLQNADLGRANLQKANFGGANLQKANLWLADLRKARLWQANLQDANLGRADLQKAELWQANLQNAKLDGANLKKSKLGQANLEKAELGQANLQKAELGQADLRKATVTGLKYKKLGKCGGIRLEGCYGSQRFIRDVKDNEYVEEFEYNHPFLCRLWSISSDCGRSIGLWISWSLLFAIYFGLNFFFLSPERFTINGENLLPFDLVTVIYHSVVAFTTLGFVDVTPNTLTGAWWIMAEVVIGYVMLGGLISIMITKLARRAQ